MSFLALWLPLSVLAWNAGGHRLVAAIAWQELAAGERAVIAALLDAHPDAARWERKIRTGDDRALVMFTEASTWADDIRRDQRFYDEGRDAETPLLPGFPDMARRRTWHYLNLPVGEVRRHDAPAGELDRRIRRLAEALADRRATRSARAYALVWLIHLVGDIHQPLHVATRHDAHGDNDSGGNGLPVIDPDNTRHPDTNLHAWWDDLPAPPWLRGPRLLATAEHLRRSPPAAAVAAARAGDTDLWRDESYRLAKTFAYGAWSSSPVRLDADYRRQARRIADERIAIAGYRLARLLTELLAFGHGPSLQR